MTKLSLSDWIRHATRSGVFGGNMGQMSVQQRVEAFCDAFDLRLPILLAPMAGACPVGLSSAVANTGGMAACGALLMSPEGIGDWARSFRTQSNGAFQINLWIPDPDPRRDPVAEADLRAFLGQWGPEVSTDAAEAQLQDFDAQCAAILAAGPSVISSIMGVYPEPFVRAMKDHGIRWFANVTTVGEALEAESAGADVIIAQGMEAGGHRGAFNADQAASALVGLFSLLPAVVDAVKVPVVATGGIADARGIAAALMLGASAVQIGTGFLRTPEAALNTAWADALAAARPEGTMATRAFSGRLGRSLRTPYAEAAVTGPEPAPYPIQRALTAQMRGAAANSGKVDAMQAWAGQSAGMAQAEPAGALMMRLWDGARDLLNG